MRKNEFYDTIDNMKGQEIIDFLEKEFNVIIKEKTRTPVEVSWVSVIDGEESRPDSKSFCVEYAISIIAERLQ